MQEISVYRSSGAVQQLHASNGKSFRDLYKACDMTDYFDNKVLSKHANVIEKCSVDPNNLETLLEVRGASSSTSPSNAPSAIYWVSKSSVDADGAPVSCGANKSITDQCQTWFNYDNSENQSPYLDAEVIPYIVIPDRIPGHTRSFSDISGIQAGDLAFVEYQGRCIKAIVGDLGPYYRIGEASLAVHEMLGNPQCTSTQKPCPAIINNAMGIGIPGSVKYLVFPGTRPKDLRPSNLKSKLERGLEQQSDAFIRRSR